MRYWLLCALSGCGWALIAWLLADRHLNGIVLGGMLASPIIGLCAGFLYRPFYGSRAWVRIGMALVTLLVTVALFGLAMGGYDAIFRASPNRDGVEVVVEAILMSVWGIAIMGYWIFLWPLAYGNHLLVGRAAGLD